jgi:hypothetical protein
LIEIEHLGNLTQTVDNRLVNPVEFHIHETACEIRDKPV